MIWVWTGLMLRLERKEENPTVDLLDRLAGTLSVPLS